MQKIIETLQDKLIFNLFLRAVFETNFADILDGKGPFTVFAPIDGAFELLAKKDLDRLASDPELTSDMISQHIVIGSLNSAQIADMDELPTMANQTLAVEQHNEGLILGGAKIIERDIECENGMLHVIDTILFP